MDYKIKKISETNIDLLNQFYKLAFPSRYKSLIKHWKWYYKIGDSNFEPLVLECKGKIVGMAGLIPENLSFEGKIHQAIWFTDFYILKEFRNKGLGSILTKEWMKICPIQITYCNEESLKVFKKFNWKNNNIIYRKINPINISNLIPIFNKLNFNLKIKLFKKKNKNFENFKQFQPDKIKIQNIKKYCKLEEQRIKNGKTFSIIRDENWFEWRFINCPYSSEIFEFECNQELVIAHIYKKDNKKRLNILYSHTQEQDSIIYDLVYNWSVNNNIDFIWSLNSEQKKIFKENFITNLFLKRKINFAFWAEDNQKFTHLEKGFANSQGSDSDLESNLYQDE